MSSQVPDFVILDSADDKKNKVANKTKEEKKNPVVDFIQEKVVKPVQNFVDNNKSRENQIENREFQVESRGKGIGAAESRASQQQIDKIGSKEFDENNRALVRASKTEDEFVRSMKARGFTNLTDPDNEKKLRLYYQGVKPEVGDLDNSSDEGTGVETGTGTTTTTGTETAGAGEGDGGEGNPPPEDDEKDKKKKKKKDWKPALGYVGNKRAYSIWDARNKGLLDTGGATYYTIDAIANYLQNVARGIGNVGAQFTGGTIDNNVNQSEWSKAMSEMNKEERQKWIEGQGSKAERQATQENIANQISSIEANILGNRESYMQYCKQQAEKALAAGNEYGAISWMALSMNYAQNPSDAIKGSITANLATSVEKYGKQAMDALQEFANDPAKALGNWFSK